MFCGECGHRWAADEIANAKFCAECGALRENPPPLNPTSLSEPITKATSSTPQYASFSSATSFPITSSSYSSLHNNPSVTPSFNTLTSLSAQPHQSTSHRSSAGKECVKCRSALSDPSAVFCGDCGHPCYSHTRELKKEEDAGLFGSNTYSPAASFTSQTAAPNHLPDNRPGTSMSFSGKNTPSSAYAAPNMHHPPQTTRTMSAGGLTSQLSTLSVTPPSIEGNALQQIESNGNGQGIMINRAVRARNVSSLDVRKQISEAIVQTKSRPQERVEGYHLSRVKNNITVIQREGLVTEEERFYNDRCLLDDGSWTQILRQHRKGRTKFTDPQFPPDQSSLFRDAYQKQLPHLEEYVWKWKRVSEFFHEIAYVEITMLDDDKKMVCSMAIKTPAEAESILSVIRQHGTSGPVNAEFMHIAKKTVTAGITNKKREHLLFLTTNMISYMSEYVQDGMQRFQLFWDKSLLQHYKPLEYTHVGEGSGYRIESEDSMSYSKVSVLVPIYFQAQGTCVFDRSLENGSTGRVSGVGIQPGAIRQGRLGDAYIFGALSILSTSSSALAQVFPDLDDDLIKKEHVEPGSPYRKEQQYNEEGVYAVRVWKNHQSRVVIIDDFIPCSQYGKPVFASLTGNNGKFEIWSMLIEKAYAKLYGGYEMIAGGQEAYCLQDLYGGIPVTYELQEQCRTESKAWDAIVCSLDAGSLIGCINEKVEIELPVGLRKSCAYGILKVVELTYEGQQYRLIQLRNSWGIGSLEHPEKWKGSWSNVDSRWQKFFRLQKVDCGFQFREDDTYWMEFSAFFTFFSKIVESRNLYNFASLSHGTGNPVPATQSIHIINGEWNGTTFGGRDGMHLNPQYQLFVPSATNCSLTVHLEQPSRRVNMLQEYPLYIAPVLFKNGEKSQRKIDLSPDVVSMGTFISNRSSLSEIASLDCAGHDQQKPFVVSPVTYEGNVGQPQPFTLVIFSSKPTAIMPISDTDSLPICCVCHRPLSGTFRTFTYAKDGQTRMDRVCKDTCMQVYRDRTTPVCVECHERIERVDGRFSGRLFTLPDGASVHAECIDAYRLRTVDKCVHCNYAIMPISGRFDGRYFEINGDKCHGECMDDYQRNIAKRCLQCYEPVMKIPGRFDGRFYKTNPALDDQLVHFECWETYQDTIASKCVQCFNSIVKKPGKYDGRFYELSDGSGKVHFECWEVYQKSISTS